MPTQAPNIRLLMLNSKLETLRSKQEPVISDLSTKLYAQKLASLPLEPRSQLASEIIKEPLLTQTPRGFLNFTPVVALLKGSINLKVVAGAVAVVLLSVVALSGFMAMSKPTTTQVAKAKETVIENVSTDPLKISESYKTISKEREYGDVLFTKLEGPNSATMVLSKGSIPFGKDSFVYQDYSVLPGVKGHSIFVSGQENPLIQKLVPGDRVSLEVGDQKNPTKTYKYIFISSNEYKLGDTALLTNTAKSILNCNLVNGDKVTSYQFRLIGLE